MILFFFFQAEDGIRDVAVTGVQTCALPIFCVSGASRRPRFPVRTCAWWSAARLAGNTSRAPRSRDRKSTRLNSSHGYISYAVFCLKKKKKKKDKNLKGNKYAGHRTIHQQP